MRRDAGRPTHQLQCLLFLDQLLLGVLLSLHASRLHLQLVLAAQVLGRLHRVLLDVLLLLLFLSLYY